MNFRRLFARFFKLTTFKLTPARKLVFTVPFLYFSMQKFRQIQTFKCSGLYAFISEAKLKQLRHTFDNLVLIDKIYTEHILAVLREKSTGTKDFRAYADRLIRILLEKSIAYHEKKFVEKKSPVGTYVSVELAHEEDCFCVVPILRSGNAFLSEMFRLMPGISVGQILIQRPDEDLDPQVFYTKFPKDIASKKVLIVDAVLGTGKTANLAIKILKEQGVEESNISFVNVISCEDGITAVMKNYPKVDPYYLATTKNQDAPGLRDFGDRYFGT